MPNLMESIEELKLANAAKVTKPQELRALEVANDENNVAKVETALATASQVEISVDASESKEFIHVSQFSCFAPHEVAFLNETHFNQRMIEEGFKLWKEPFDEFDFADIRSGVTSKRDAIDYLYLWWAGNLERYKLLAGATENN